MKPVKFLYPILLLCFIFSCKKDEPISALHVYGSYGKDSCYNALECSDGSWLFCGNTADSNQSTMLLTKTDGHGNLLWSANYAGSRLSKGMALGQTADGNYILLGDTGGNQGDRKLVYIKTDKDGNQLSMKVISLPFPSLRLKSMIPASAGGFVLLVKKKAANGYGQPALVAIDDDGNIKWIGEPVTTLPITSASIEPQSILETDMGFMIAGQVLGKDFQSGVGVQAAYIFNTDKTGKMLKEKLLSFSLQGTATTLAGSGNSFVASGLMVNPGTFINDLFVAGISANIDSLWMKSFGGNNEEGNTQNIPYCKVIKKASGGYLVCSTSKSFKLGNSLVYVISLTAEGSKEWEKTYGGIKGDFFANKIMPLTTGGYLISGHTSGFGSGINEMDFFCLKINEDGEMVE